MALPVLLKIMDNIVIIYLRISTHKYLIQTVLLPLWGS